MREYIYPAVFHPNDDGSFTVTFPNLPGCISEGKSLDDAMHMAQAALAQWLEYLTDKELKVPSASGPHDIEAEPGEFVNLVHADTKSG